MLHTLIHSSGRAKAPTTNSTGFSRTSHFQNPIAMTKHLGWLCCLLLWCASVPLPAQTVVINEIMYHPPTTNLLEEWFEIFNPATNTVDLSGWQITKGVQFTFPTNTAISAGDRKSTR